MDITAGSTVTVGSYARVCNGADSTGTLNITDSNFNVGTYLQVANGADSVGKVYMTDSTVVINNVMRLAKGDGADGYVKIDNTDLSIGEVGTKELRIAEATNDTAYSTATMEIVNGSTVGVGTYIRIGTKPNATGTLTIDNSSMTVGTDVNVGTQGGTGTLNVINGGSLSMGVHLTSANGVAYPDGVGTIIVNNGSITTGENFKVGSGAGTATADLTNATITSGTEVRVAETELSIGYLNINSGTTINCGLDFETCTGEGTISFANPAGKAYIHMYDGDVNVDGYMCLSRELQGGSYTEFVMDAGTVDIGLDAGTDYEFLDNLIMGWFDTDAEAYLTLNGGRMTVAGDIRFGCEYTWDGTSVTTTGSDTGNLEITIDGGILQAEDYVDAGTFTNHVITFTEGQFRLNGDAVSETGMADLISAGDIACTGAYYIYTEGNYTVLSSSEQPNLIPGDTNHDNIVDEKDARVLAQAWGSSTTGGAEAGDFNGDEMVNVLDAAILAANWGDHTGGEATASVPEPGALAMLLAGIVGVLLTRRS
jgi:hypothetical protein